MPRYELGRTKFVFILKNGRTYKTQKPKGLPPPNVSIYKGSTHIIAIRQFVEFVLHGQIGKDFYEFLKDTRTPDETTFSSYKDIHEFQAESTEINQHGYHGPCIGLVRKTVAFVV